jgi:hypothetical protein
MEPKGVLVHIHRSGWTVYEKTVYHESGSKSKGTISGYGEKGWEKYVDPGCPVVNTKTIPLKLLSRWALFAPMVDPDLTESESTEVAPNDAGLSTGKYAEFFQTVREHGTPDLRMATYLNLARCTIEDYCKLAEEFGATVSRYNAEWIRVRP